MSPFSDHPPSSGLGTRLLEAARHDTGSEASDFSLDLLTARAITESSPSGSGIEEDSGLIDLKALARSPDAGATSRAPWAGDGVLPLGAPPPEPGRADVPNAPRRMARTRRAQNLLVASLAGAAVVLTATVVLLLVRGPTGQDRAITPMAGASTPAQPLAPADEAIDPVPEGHGSEPLATTTAVDAATTPTSCAPGARTAPIRSSVPRPSIPPGPSVTGVPSAAPAGRGSEPCPCRQDDLLCHMHCRVKK